MDNLKIIANRTIPKGSDNIKVLKKDGNTQDIVNAILLADSLSAPYTKDFAPSLKGRNIHETSKKIFDFVLNNIRYVEDPFGLQDAKSPAQTWTDGFADCKSMSIFTASILNNLHIPYSFRFASYGMTPRWTHVYVIAHSTAGDIIIDPVYKKFNQQKPYNFKKDYMTEVRYISGIGSDSNNPKPGFKFIRKHNGKVVKVRVNHKTRFKLPDKHLHQITEAEMIGAIAAHRYEIEKDIIEQRRGVGSLRAEQYQDAIDCIGDVNEVLSDPSLTTEEKIAEIGLIETQAENGEYSLAGSILGIGIGRKSKADRKKAKDKRKADRKAHKAQKKQIRKQKHAKSKAKRKAFFKKIGNGLKKGLKAFAKVASAPERLAAKGILEVLLPKSSSFFLYLFVPDNKVSKLPLSVQKKRAKEVKVKNFIVNTIGMKDAHFMGIVRNGITKRYHRSPEAMVSKYIDGTVSGIGDAGEIASMASQAAPVIMQILDKLKEIFGAKHDDSVSAQDAPDPSDFDNQSDSVKNEIKQATLGNEDSATASQSMPDTSSLSDSSNDDGSGSGSSDNSSDSSSDSQDQGDALNLSKGGPRTSGNC
jgi:hypothetical protein